MQQKSRGRQHQEAHYEVCQLFLCRKKAENLLASSTDEELKGRRLSGFL